MIEVSLLLLRQPARRVLALAPEHRSHVQFQVEVPQHLHACISWGRVRQTGSNQGEHVAGRAATGSYVEVVDIGCDRRSEHTLPKELQRRFPR
jgi:hypothetical protein